MSTILLKSIELTIVSNLSLFEQNHMTNPGLRQTHTCGGDEGSSYLNNNGEKWADFWE